MIENIVLGVISGLITAVVLELIKRVSNQKGYFLRKKKDPEILNSGQRFDIDLSKIGIALSTVSLRLIVSTLVGYCLGWLTAGILEEGFGYKNITVGSTIYYILIIGWTIIIWSLIIPILEKWLTKLSN